MDMSIENKIHHYQKKINKSYKETEGVRNEHRLLKCVQKLSKLPITVLHLKLTDIAKTINALSIIDGQIGKAAELLVTKWREMVMAEIAANTDTSVEEDEACVPDLPKCDESPECHRETEEDAKSKSRAQNYEPEALRGPTHTSSSSKEKKNTHDGKRKRESGSSDKENSNKRRKLFDSSRGIDCNSGTSFADALGMCMVPLPAKKEKASTSSKTPQASKMDSSLRSHSIKSLPPKSKSDSPGSPEVLSLLSPNVELPPLHQIEVEVDLTVTIPEPSFSYKASKQDPAELKREEDLMLSKMISSKNQKTKVYSGNKSALANIPSPSDICARVLTTNINSIQHTGGVPFDILKPALEQATPEQLFKLEYHNSYLLENTDYLWKFHCQKDFKTEKRNEEEMESWREMYTRCLDEREKKLNALRTNINQSIANAPPVKKTKMAYVDNIQVKPPREVLRKQAKFGTSNLVAKADLRKILITSSSESSCSSGGTSASEKISVPPPPPSSTRRQSSSDTVTKTEAPLVAKASRTVKKTTAPLMAKALRALKGRYRR